MSLVRSARRFGVIVRDLRRALRHRPTLEESRAYIQARLRSREPRFLRLLERGVFGYPRSPYLPLLREAHCELEDIRRLVNADGLDHALRALFDAGVRVTYEEFRGRAPIVRNGRTLNVRPEDFDNPFVTAHYQSETGGTTGKAARAPIEFAHIAALVPHFKLSLDAYGLSQHAGAIWRGILPDGSGLNNVLRLELCGQPADRWFSQLAGRDLQLSRLKTDVATRMIVLAGRLAGARMPWPETVPVERADIVARWAGDTLKQGRGVMILTQVSRALRVALAARELDISLEGTTFLVGGEPATAAKAAQIKASGARVFPGYAFVEAGGRVGSGCANPLGPNDVHVHTDAFALFSALRNIPGGGQVPALYFTTLEPTTPKIMINVENDDYATIETRSCGCPLGTVGLTQHLRDIRSFSKLTGEGVTLIGSEMVAILEHVLPGRFGGSALDYQLLEEEDEQGFTRLTLLVSPHLPIANDNDIVQTVFQALGESSVGADQARDMWQRAGTLRVRRTPPIWTARGKMMTITRSNRESEEVRK